MTKTTAPTVICAWCDRLMTAGTGIVSHGICRECARSFIAAITNERTGSIPNRPDPGRNRNGHH